MWTTIYFISYRAFVIFVAKDYLRTSMIEFIEKSRQYNAQMEANRLEQNSLRDYSEVRRNKVITISL